MPSYALISTNPSSPPPTWGGGGGGTESTEGVGWQEPPSASNAVGGATDLPSKIGLKLVCNVYGNFKSENSQDYAQKPQ